MALFTVKFNDKTKPPRTIKAVDYERDEHGFTNFKGADKKTIASIRTDEIAGIDRS